MKNAIMINKRLNIFLIFISLFFCFSILIKAQENSGANITSQANNPLAKFTAFNIHNYYIGELTSPDKAANQIWIRFAKPFSIGETDWIMRASLPINTFPVAPTFESKTGIGDLNIFAAYLIDIGNPTLSFGIGPQLTAPTATVTEIGSEKWSAGLVNTLFSFKSKVFQYGYLLSWQASFAGDENREDINLGAFQPFLFFQLGSGTYLRSTGVCAYNFENSTYSIPIGLGIGQVIPSESIVFNLFIEPQFSVADKGAGWPKWQVFIGLNSQIK